MPFVSLKRVKSELLTKSIGELNEVSGDLKIICSNGIVWTHQAMLSWSSSFLRRLFMAQLILEDGGKRKEEISLYLDGFSTSLVNALIEFFINGELRQIVSKEFVEDFEQLWEDIKIDKVSYKEVFDGGKSLTVSSSIKSLRKRSTAPTNVSSPATRSSRGKSPPGPPTSTSKAPPLPVAGKTVSGIPPRSPAVLNTSATGKTKLNNQSLPFNTPKFSSTPIRPGNKIRKSVLKTNLLSTVPEKLGNNPQISVKEGTEVPPPIVVDEEDDAIEIVGEVTSATKVLPVNIKHELPAGISITKSQVKITKNPEPESNVKKDLVIENASQIESKSNQEESKENNEILQNKTSQDVNKVSKFAKSKLKRAKSLGRKPTIVMNNNSSLSGGRRLTRRSTSSVPTYNEDILQKSLFEKKEGNSKSSKDFKQPNLSDSFQTKIIQKTKSLRIPLTKVKDDKLNTLKQKKDQAELARSRLNSPKTSVTAKITPVTTTIVPKTPLKPVQSSTVSIPKSALKKVEKVDPDSELIPCYICKQTKDDKNRGLCLKNINVLRSHVSICLYLAGKLFKAIPPGKDNTDDEGKPIDEFGGINGKKYCCEVEGCWLASRKGKSGQVGYKEYAIHMSSQHGALEMVLMEDGEEAEKLMEKLMDYEGSKNTSIVKNDEAVITPAATLDENVFVVKEEKSEVPPEPLVKVVKTPGRRLIANSPAISRNQCFFCKESLNFKDIMKLREHLATCLYNDKKFTNFVSPGPSNSAENLDEVKCLYKCDLKGCNFQKQYGNKLVNYKVYALHMAVHHGVLEKILEADSRPAVKMYLQRLKISPVGSGVSEAIECRFGECKAKKFKAESKREIKLHYASHHFNDFFIFNPDTGVPENFTKTGNRTMCNSCSSNAPKPVYIQSEKEAIRGHLVVKHDIMADILMQAHSKNVAEAKQALQDIYPDIYQKKFATDEK